MISPSVVNVTKQTSHNSEVWPGLHSMILWGVKQTLIWEDWGELHFSMLEPMSSLETKVLHFYTQDFLWTLY